MLKQILLLIVFSVLAVIFKNQLAVVIKIMLLLHTQISHVLVVIFAFDKVGEIVQSVIALLLIPVVIAVLVAVAHFFIRQAHFPHIVPVIWALWAVLLTALVSHTVYSQHMVSDDVHITHMDAAERQHLDVAPSDEASPKDQKASGKNDNVSKDQSAVTSKDQPLPAGPDAVPASPTH